MLAGNGWCICVHNFKSISSKMAELWHKTCKKQALFMSFRDFSAIFLILFLPILTLQTKSVLGSFFAFFAKIWPKNWYHSFKFQFLLFDLLYLVTWGGLDLCILWSQSTGNDTNVRHSIHADSLTLFELNIDIVLADVTKPEKSNILTLTWPVTSLVTQRSLKRRIPGLSKAAWILIIGPVVSEFRGREGGLEIALPPVGRVIKIPTPVGRGLNIRFSNRPRLADNF